MAYIRRRKGSWQTVIRVQGYPPITKTFKTKIDAQRYSRDLENKLFREKHDIAKKKFPIMRDALIRYRDEVTAHKRSKEMETKLIKYILSEGFVNYAVNLVDRSLIALYRDRALRSLKSSSVNRRLAIISHLFTICKKEWGYDVANPVLSIRRPTNPEPRDRRFTQQELDKIFTCNRTNPCIFKNFFNFVIITTQFRNFKDREDCGKIIKIYLVLFC